MRTTDTDQRPATICAALGCDHPVQRPGGASPYCVAHAGLVYRFHRWLDGDVRDLLSFDRDRAGHEHGTWHPV